MMRYIFYTSVGIVLLAVSGMLVFLYFDSAEQLNTANTSTESTPPPERGEILEVIDGLTIKLASGHKVRYLGVRMPNIRQEIECYGKEALAMNESVIGKTIRLEGDPILDRAEDGAWLRYVFIIKEETGQSLSEDTTSVSVAPINDDADFSGASVEISTNDASATLSMEPFILPESDLQHDSTIKKNDEIINEQIDDGEESNRANENDDYMINERIIEMGVGFPLLNEGMIYFNKMASAMKYSRATKKGLWGNCEIDALESGLPRTNVVKECVIKGKVLMNGDRVYREPACAAYGNTVVLQYSKGDAWLCTKEEAEEGGWKRAKDC